MIDIIHGDCLEEMAKMPDGSIDAIIVDPPFGTLQCRWDVIIPFDPMWEQIRRVTKKNAAIVIMASNPFTSLLISSNIKEFRYTWAWEKSNATGFLNAKKMPLRAHEDIPVFYRKSPTYNPQMTQGHTRKTSKRTDIKTDCYGKADKPVEYDSTERYPRSVLYFPRDTQKSSLHSTQKPLALMEYLVKTYTNEGDTVLDFAAGSFTTGLACKNNNRNFVGIEKELEYVTIGKERLK